MRKLNKDELLENFIEMTVLLDIGNSPFKEDKQTFKQVIELIEQSEYKLIKKKVDVGYWARRFNAESEKNFRKYPQKETLKKTQNIAHFQFLIEEMLVKKGGD